MGMGDIVQEALNEERGGLFARWFVRAMDKISDIIGEIESVLTPDFSFEGGMYVSCTKTPGFMPKDKLQKLFAAVVAAFDKIDADSLKAAIEHIENFQDNYAIIIRQLYENLDSGIGYFKFEVSSIDLVDTASAALLHYIELLRAPIRGESYDLEAVRRAGVRLLEAITPLMEDVYRDETIPPYDVPEPTDAPVSFLPPDPSEIPGHLPSKAEAKNFLDDWFFQVKGCGALFMHLDSGEELLFAKDCIARLWGYSERICQSNRYKNRQACRMPRIALCPFYDILFRLVHCLFGAAKQYETRQLDNVRGSDSIKSTNWSEFPLPRLMRQVLRFAPREYFSEDCHHHAYLILARSVLFSALDRVSYSIPAESRFVAVQQIDRIKHEFDAFVDKLHKPATGTERSYAAEVDAIINPFRDAFLALASVLKAVEDQIEWEMEHPNDNAPATTADLSSAVRQIVEEGHKEGLATRKTIKTATAKPKKPKKAKTKVRRGTSPFAGKGKIRDCIEVPAECNAITVNGRVYDRITGFEVWKRINRLLKPFSECNETPVPFTAKDRLQFHRGKAKQFLNNCVDPIKDGRKFIKALIKPSLVPAYQREDEESGEAAKKPRLRRT